MNFIIQDNQGKEVHLRPRVELYQVQDFKETMLPGIAVVLDEVDKEQRVKEEYATLTVSFGEFIGPENCAYIDTNNCWFAEQLLQYDIAEPTNFYKTSGFCRYPLWHFKEDFLKEIGGENYANYAQAREQYFSESPFGFLEAEEPEEEISQHRDIEM